MVGDWHMTALERLARGVCCLMAEQFEWQAWPRDLSLPSCGCYILPIAELGKI